MLVVPAQQASGGTDIPTYATRAALPAVAKANDLAVVLQGTGVWPLNKPAGLYWFNGSSWKYRATPSAIDTRLKALEARRHFVGSTATAFDNDYNYYLLNLLSGWQINRVKRVDATRTKATNANNSGYATGSAAWAARSSLSWQ